MPSFSAFWSSDSTSRRAPARSRSPAFMAVTTSRLICSAIGTQTQLYGRGRSPGRPKVQSLGPQLRGFQVPPGSRTQEPLMSRESLLWEPSTPNPTPRPTFTPASVLDAVVS